MGSSKMYNDRLDNAYLQGVDKFCKILVDNLQPVDKGYILCPCIDCKNNFKYRDVDKIKDHLIRRGFTKDYEDITLWHGQHAVDVFDCVEEVSVEPELDGTENFGDDTTNFEDADNCTINDELEDVNLEAMLEDVEEYFTNKPNAHENFMQSCKEPLYPGCDALKLNKLSVTLKLFNVKSKHGWSDVSFTDLLQIIKEILPADNVLPRSTYEAKKLMCPMGMEYIKIHACPSGCILFWKEHELDDCCPKCGESRYVKKDHQNDNLPKVRSPAKVLWYLPIIPRFRRLFAVKKDAENLRWHATHRKDDGKLRHLADSPQWRNIDRMYPEFGMESRNLRLGLCTDGMNPYGTLSSVHSTWPVLLTIYNLPPWLCMKPRHIILSMLIAGPKQPGNKIDVFLQPLIDDLKLLWNEGAIVYDSYAKENFTLRAMLFCTINDFPAYGNLSGYTIKGALACPVCSDNTCSIRLKHSGKNVYMGHRKFLPRHHKYRKMTNEFDGKTDHAVSRQPLSGVDVYNRVKDIVNNFGPPTKHTPNGLWKKRSIFFDLEYWQHLQVRHCIDAMHVEKNVGESLCGTLLNIKGKTKDHLKGRRDLVELGIRKELQPQQRGNRIFLPPACHTLSKEEKNSFCSALYNIKVPSGYSSNVRSWVAMSELKLVGMKSHDYHVLMQHLLPISIRGILPDDVRKTITNLSVFFNGVSAKVLDVQTLDKLQAELIVTMCQLEMYFPPSFFDIMVHLLVHLVREIKECGPLYLRYMYPFERYMGVLKRKMKNRRRPEGSIVEGTVTEEVIDFCTHYLESVNYIGLPRSRHEGKLQGVGKIGKKMVRPDFGALCKAHLTVLSHIEDVEPYFASHLSTLRAQHPSMSDVRLKKEQNATFVTWFREKVMHEDSDNVAELVKLLALGPNLDVMSYEGFDVNGFTFYTERQDRKSTNQNSGIHLTASQEIYQDAGSKGVATRKEYYGVIQEIWILNYTCYETCVFQCKWVDNNRSYRQVEHGMKLVDLNAMKYTDEPFIIASKARQVFYCRDQSNPKWSVVLQSKRMIVGVDGVVDEEDYDYEMDNVPLQLPMEVNNVTNFQCTRSDHEEGLWVEK